MARAYWSDLRERVLRACAAGEETQALIARRFAVSEGCVSMWRKEARATGRRHAQAHAGGRVMLAGNLPVLDELAAAPPDALLAEYAAWMEERTGRRHSLPALCRALRRLGWRRKKSRCRPTNSSARMFRPSARPGALSNPLGLLRN
jgi:transposase